MRPGIFFGFFQQPLPTSLFSTDIEPCSKERHFSSTPNRTPSVSEFPSPGPLSSWVLAQLPCCPAFFDRNDSPPLQEPIFFKRSANDPTYYKPILLSLFPCLLDPTIFTCAQTPSFRTDSPDFLCILIDPQVTFLSILLLAYVFFFPFALAYPSPETAAVPRVQSSQIVTTSRLICLPLT